MVAHERKLDADRAALAANQKDRKKCETDIPVQEHKISKLKDQMLTTKTNEQYRAFQNEIEFCQKEIRKLEDRILELMAESEPLENEREGGGSRAEGREGAGGSGKGGGPRAHGGRSEGGRRIAWWNAPRIAKEVTPSDLSAVRTRAQRPPRNRGCGSSGRPLHGMPDHAAAAILPGRETLRIVLFCESCQRILYYNPPQAFDGLWLTMAAAQSRQWRHRFACRPHDLSIALSPKRYPTLTPYCGTQLVPNSIEVVHPVNVELSGARKHAG